VREVVGLTCPASGLAADRPEVTNYVAGLVIQGRRAAVYRDLSQSGWSAEFPRRPTPDRHFFECPGTPGPEWSTVVPSGSLNSGEINSAVPGAQLTGYGTECR
jgi:hypothetical protein